MENESTSKEFVKQIRLKCFEERSLNRTEKRTSYLNARRANYSDIARRMKEPNVEEFVSICEHFRRDKKLSDLEKLHQHLASGRLSLIKAFLETEGVLYALIGCLSGIKTKQQTQAFYCLINLGLGSEEECVRVIKRTGAYLVSCLGSTNWHIQGLCCWAFGNLCGKNPDVCSVIRSQGFEETLACAMSAPWPFTTQWACYALNHYVNTAPDRIEALSKATLLKELMRIVSLEEEDIADAAWCLFAFSTLPESCALLVNLGVVSLSLRVLGIIGKAEVLAVETCTALVRLLSNCIAVLNEVAIEICYQADHVVSVVSSLLLSAYSNIQKEGMQFVANLVNGASAVPGTGGKILEDSNLRRKLEPVLKQAFAAQFLGLFPANYNFTSQCSEI